MAKNIFSGLFGRKNKSEPDEDESADTLKPVDKLDDDPTALTDADRPVAPPTAAPIEDTEAGAPEFLRNGESGQAEESPFPNDALEKAETDSAKAEEHSNVASEPDQETRAGWFSRLSQGLSRSSEKLTSGVSAIFTKKKLDDKTLDELTDLLITADLGVSAAARVTERLAKEKFDKEITEAEIKQALADEVADTLRPLEKPLQLATERRPEVILMVGVNGAGKTTTIGKLAEKFRRDGRSVVLAAGDTFRAAAIEQLTVWGERTGAEVVSKDIGSDAAGLAFDALTKAREKNADVLMIDTAGRLQNKAALMDELAKIIRVIRKIDETAPHHVLLVLDATVGQNALSQAEAFAKTAGVTGLVMTKLDGTARGGVLVALADKFQLPIHYVGVGETADDLQPFDADNFARALAGVQS